MRTSSGGRALLMASLLAACLSLAACGDESTSTSMVISASGGSAKVGSLQITNAIVRLTVNDVTSMYFTVRNAGGDDKLVAASSSVSAYAMLHHEVTEGNTSTMVMVDSIVIPANSTLDLLSNNYHVMLTGIQSPLKEGDRVTATLTFQKAGKVTLTVPVVSYSPAQ